MRAELTRLAQQRWRHQITIALVAFGVSTIERWYYAARRAPQDQVGVLRRGRRHDAGQQPSLGLALRQALRAQYRAHPRWSYQLHADLLCSCARTPRWG